MASVFRLLRISAANQRLNGSGICVQLLLVAIMILPFWSRQARGQEKVGTAGPSFLDLVNSSRANGMGGCAIDLVSEESGLYNPGGVGLFHLDKTVGASFPHNVKWQPNSTSDLHIKSYGVSVGMSSQRLHLRKSSLLNVGLGFAFSRLKSDYRADDQQMMLHELDRADCYTFAIAVDYLVRVGFGYTYKVITSSGDITGQGTGYEYPTDTTDSGGTSLPVPDVHGKDIGITIELPLWRILRLKHPTTLHSDPPAIQITPRFTYVLANRRIDGPLLGSTRKGLSLHARYSPEGLTIVSLVLVGEIDKNRLDTRKVWKKGIEIGCLDIGYVRLGNFRDDPMTVYGNNINTFGFGLSLNGLIKWTRICTHIPGGRTCLRQLIDNLDVRFDYARYGGKGQSYDGTKFYKLTVSI